MWRGLGVCRWGRRIGRDAVGTGRRGGVGGGGCCGGLMNDIWGLMPFGKSRNRI